MFSRRVGREITLQHIALLNIILNLFGLIISSVDRAVPRRGGGVALYVKSLLMPTRLAIDAASSCVEMVGCQIFLPSCHITVLLYRSLCPTKSDDNIALRVL